MNVNLSIQGMNCEHCVRALREALASVTGVDEPVQVSLETGHAVVGGNPDVTALIAALEDEGYDAQVLKT